MKANIIGFILLLLVAFSLNHCTGWTPGGGNQYDRR